MIMLRNILIAFLFLFGANPVFAGLKVKEQSVISVDQDYLNSQLRSLLREDVQFGVINVYDGSNWVSGSTSIHFDDVKLVILDGGVQITLKASINSPLGRKTQKISRTMSVPDFQFEIDANGICDMLADLSESVLAASDVLTDMYPGTRDAPIGLFANQLRRFVLLPKFASYLKGVSVEKCYPASFTGVVDFSLSALPGRVNIKIAPEIEYLDLKIGAMGWLNYDNTAKFTVHANFPVAVKSASAASVTGAFNNLNIISAMTTYASWVNITPWITTVNTSWGGASTAYSPDFILDVQSPCGEFIQHFQARLYNREFSFIPNEMVEVP